MNTFKIIFANGDSLTTRMNANLQEAKQYYLGNVFNLGSAQDNMQQCTEVRRVQ